MVDRRGDVSVIVSAYRQPDTLRLVMLALARQTVTPEEVLITDDGSPENLLPDAVRSIRDLLPFRLTHVWQPDGGFRLARSRNNGIYYARGGMIASLDQDTVPNWDWLETLLASAGKGRLCLGGVIRLSPVTAPTEKSIRSGECELLQPASEMEKLRALQRKAVFYTVVRRLGFPVKGRPAVAFGNAMANRDDLFNVNGFDEEYVGWGQEDDDLGWRLYLAGIRPVPLIDRALVSHLPHGRRRPEKWREGPNVGRYRQERLSPRCAKGLDAHPHPDVVVSEL